MAALQGMKRMRNDTTGEHEQQLNKRNRHLPLISPQESTTTGDIVSLSVTTGQSKPHTLLTLLKDYYLIHVGIVSKLTHKDFYALCDSSPALTAFLRRSRFGVNNKLERFFEDPKALRAVMARSATLLAGYFVLQLFADKDGKEWLKIPLEFFVTTVKNETLLKQHLSSEQYICTLTEVTSEEVQLCQNIIKTHTYERTTAKFGKTVLKVHTTEQHPLFSIITSAHFTTDLNIMSWNKAYSPFANETFSEHKMYLLGDLNNDSGAVLRTYAKLGWNTTDTVVMSETPGPPTFYDLMTGNSFPAIKLLDLSFSVTRNRPIIFNDMAVPDAVPDSVLKSCRFSFQQRFCLGGKCMDANIAAFDQPLLEYSYTQTPRAGYNFVAWRLNELLLFELAKLDPTIRPKGEVKELSDGALVMNHARSIVWKWTETTKPEDWDFQDHLLPMLLADERAW